MKNKTIREIGKIIFSKANAFRQHFEEQEYFYGKQFLISLVRMID